MKKILLVVDVQKGFITTPAVNDIKNNIDGLIKSEFFDVVISTVYQNYKDSPIIRLMGWDKLLTNDEQELIGEAHYQSDYIIKKNRYSAVNEDLVKVLEEVGDGQLPECVFVVGVDTECCVLATATDIFELGIRPIVLNKYCGSSSGLANHKAGLLSMESLVGKCNMFDGLILSKDDIEHAYEVAVKRTIEGNQAPEPIERAVVNQLKDRKWTISFAESCTGGLAVAKIVSVPDASHVLNASVVTYANEAKMKFLGVSENSIIEHGVVSEKVAEEMAIGVAKLNTAEVGVGISGIAGPGGATPKKPVGMVCFGFYIDGKTYTFTEQFGNIGRNNVRDASVDFVYNKLMELLI